MIVACTRTPRLGGADIPLCRGPQAQHSRARSPIRRSGFTLLELIVALGLTAILALSLFSSLYAAFKAKESSDRAVKELETGEIAMEMIRHDFDCVQPQRGIFAGPFEGVDNTDPRGNPGDYVTFFSTAEGPQHVDGTGEIKQVQLLTYQPQGSNDIWLVRRVTGNLLSPSIMDPDEEIIARHVWSFNLRYFDGQTWQDDWDSTQYGNVLPAAVEVTLEIKPLDAPAGAPPVHLRRVFTMPCVSPPNLGNDAAAAQGSSGQQSGAGNSAGKSSSGGGK